jgi:hypothetical protein
MAVLFTQKAPPAFFFTMRLARYHTLSSVAASVSNRCKFMTTPSRRSTSTMRADVRLANLLLPPDPPLPFLSFSHSLSSSSFFLDLVLALAARKRVLR